MELKNIVFVLDKDGTKLMPTNPCRARQLLKKNKAKVYQYKPFTIMLTHNSSKGVQSIEICQDTGEKHIGLSLKTDKKELLHAQFDNLIGEKERHDDCRKYRRERRSRKRYRKPRFNNRAIPKGWIAPTLKNEMNNHINIIKKIAKVCPINDGYIEVGSFDIQKLEAIEKGLPLPKGTDYQNGPKRGFETLRQAVFYRDNYTCQICGKGIKDGAVLRAHHVGFWYGDHSDRMANLLTACTGCHTSKNHKPGGKLYGLKPKLRPFIGAAFMNTVRWMLVDKLKEELPDISFHVTYGSDTRVSRSELDLEKSHANDAYAMGNFHPKKMAEELHFKKMRRNNRILQKFYDAKYIDKRDGSTKKGAEIGCNRTNRSEPRNSDKNERMYRGHKKSKGRVAIRRKRYQYQPGDIVIYRGKKCIVVGIVNYGNYIRLNEFKKDVKVSDIKPYRYTGGWCVSSPSKCGT